MRRAAFISDSYLPDLPALAVDLPILFGDEGLEHMGETSAHTHSALTSYVGLLAHFADKPEYRVFANMSLYYHPVNRHAYIAPDVMVVCPSRPLGDSVESYRIGIDGPAPLTVVESLGRKSLQLQDLTVKPLIYAQIGVKEVLYVDTTGQYLPSRLQLRRLQFRDETWSEVPIGENGMLTSAFGYSVTIEADGKVRFSNPTTKRPYPRVEETHDVVFAWGMAMETLAQTKTAKRHAEDQVRSLKSQLRAAEERLRSIPSAEPATIGGE